MDQRSELVGKTKTNDQESFYRSKRWVHIGEYKAAKDYLESNTFDSKFEKARRWRRPDSSKGLRDLLFDRGISWDEAIARTKNIDASNKSSDFNIMAVVRKNAHK